MSEKFEQNPSYFEVDFENMPPSIITAEFDKLGLVELRSRANVFCEILDYKLTYDIYTLDRQQMIIVCSQLIIYYYTLLEIDRKIN